MRPIIYIKVSERDIPLHFKDVVHKELRIQQWHLIK